MTTNAADNEAWFKQVRERQAEIKHEGEKWAKEHPDEMAWMRNAAERGNDFAKSVLGWWRGCGPLTDKQLDAVRKCMKPRRLK
ncbi:MAG: hypothetical protein WBR29_03320 [Gammaproteobacteria bacterium]